MKPKNFDIRIITAVRQKFSTAIMKRYFYLHILVLFLAFFSVQAQTDSNADQTKIRLETFEKVWTTVNEKHFDPAFGGVDWKKIGEDYRPKIIAAKSDAEFYSLLQAMLGELNQSHFGIIPPNSEISATSFGEGEIGIEIQLLDGQAVISRVDPNSTADKAGLKTGFLIEKIDGKTIGEILAPLNEKLSKRRDTEPKKMLYRERTVMTAISGKDKSIVNIEAVDGQNQTRTFNVERSAYTGEMSPALGNFPPQQVIFESKILTENIGYIRFNVWVMPQMGKLREAISSMKDAKGIIFDLRGNPGGVGGMSNGIAGLLFEKAASLGTMKYRSGEMNFNIYPQKDAFAGKIIIVTDYGSASTSEVFAAGMQETGRARIVGETTAGAVLPSVIEKLPTGALFQYAIADYKSPKKILIEGRGVIPDIAVELTRQTLLENRDLQIETAIKEILEK